MNTGSYHKPIHWYFSGDEGVIKESIRYARVFIQRHLDIYGNLGAHPPPLRTVIFGDRVQMTAVYNLHLGDVDNIYCVLQVLPEEETVGLGKQAHGLYERVLNPIDETALRMIYLRDGSDWEVVPDFSNTVTNLRFPTGYLPTMYSGRMRAVVQDINSRDITNPYSPTFSKTHGVYTASDGNLWVVEITSSGVSAWLAERAEQGANEVIDTLPYSIVPNEPDSKTNLVVSGTQLSEVYNGSAFFPECGWALSESGSKACVVTEEERNDSPNRPGAWFAYSRLWVLNITEKDNRPDSVSVSLQEEGWLWGNKLAHFKYPDYTKSTLLSYDWWRQNYNPPWVSDSDGNYPEQKPPIHAWYKGESLQVVRYHSMKNRTSESYPDRRPSSSLSIAQYKQAKDGDYKWGTNGKENSYLCFSTPANPVPLAIERTFGDWGELKILGQYQFVDYDNGDRWSDEARGPADRVQAISYSGGRTDKTNWDTVIIPFNDRESVAHYRLAGDATTPPATTKSGGYQSIEWLVLTEGHTKLNASKYRQSGWLDYGRDHPLIFRDYSYDILFMYTQNSRLPAEVVSGVEWYSDDVTSYSGRFKWMGNNSGTYAYGSTYSEAGKRYVDWWNDESAKSEAASGGDTYDEHRAKYDRAVHSYTKVSGGWQLNTIGVGTINRGDISNNRERFYLVANRIGRAYRYTGGAPITDPVGRKTVTRTNTVGLSVAGEKKQITPSDTDAWKAFVDPVDTSYFGIKRLSQFYGVVPDTSDRVGYLYMIDPVTGTILGNWSGGGKYPANEVRGERPTFIGNP